MADRAAVEGSSEKALTLALPKGRVLDESLKALRSAGLEVELSQEPRALRHLGREAAVIEMRNADVPVYVELGVADAGIVGKDVLLEAGSDLYEPVDLGFAVCRLSLIRPRGEEGTIQRVATKYPRVTASYLRRLGSSAEVVHLAGNVELACLTGLADAVVDVVETGETLRANGLAEVDVILESSARFVVNRAALKLKGERLRPLIDGLRAIREGSGV